MKRHSKNPAQVLAIATILLAAPAFGQFGPSPEAKKGGPFTFNADGNPNIEGFWDTDTFSAAWDIEPFEGGFEIPQGPGIILAPTSKKVPYTPEGLAEYQDRHDNHLASDPQAHCFLSGVPRQMYTPFGMQFMQGDDQIIIAFEAFHAYRIIYMTGEHPDPAIKLFEGDSRGKWIGNTLVVDVANLSDRTWYDMDGNFHGPDTHITEYYTPINENLIQYRAVIIDPGILTEPMILEMGLVRNQDPEYEQLEYACVEGEQDLQHYTVEDGGAAAVGDNQ